MPVLNRCFLDVPQGTRIGNTLEKAYHSSVRAAEMSRLMLTLPRQTVSNPRPIDLAGTCLGHLAGQNAVMPRPGKADNRYPRAWPDGKGGACPGGARP